MNVKGPTFVLFALFLEIDGPVLVLVLRRELPLEGIACCKCFTFVMRPVRLLLYTGPSHQQVAPLHRSVH